MLSVRFWGDRGSIPCPGPATVTYGGNTSCLEIRADERLVIIDFGTGIKPFGDWLMANDFKKGPIDTDIFITHTHWDHIMGFPMFTPIFIPSSKLRIRGPVSYEDDTLESIIGAQLSYRYWPVRQSELSAKIEYAQIKETSLDLGDGLWVTTKYLNHPILCLGYRFEYKGKTIVTAYDNEPFRNLFPTDPADPSYDEDAAREGEQVAREENEKVLRFFLGADVLIHDAQYTAAEYKAHLGWGH
jgi:phosphoribosyl 1,2-cyclic phosphodiesterase